MSFGDTFGDTYAIDTLIDFREFHHELNFISNKDLLQSINRAIHDHFCPITTVGAICCVM